MQQFRTMKDKTFNTLNKILNAIDVVVGIFLSIAVAYFLINLVL